MKKIIALLVIIVLIGLGVTTVFATQTPYKVICHHTPGNDVTLSFQNQQSYNGHLGTPHNQQTYDTNGACVSPTSTPTKTPTPTVTPTATPTINPCQSLEVVKVEWNENPCVTPTAGPSPTPTPTIEQPKENKPEGCTENCGVPACTAEAPGMPVNFHVYRNGGTAILKWWATGGNKVNIYYKEKSSPNWVYSVIGVENTGNFQVDGLGKLDITFGIEQVNDCQPSQQVSFQSVVVDGETNNWTLFQ